MIAINSILMMEKMDWISCSLIFFRHGCFRNTYQCSVFFFYSKQEKNNSNFRIWRHLYFIRVSLTILCACVKTVLETNAHIFSGSARICAHRSVLVLVDLSAHPCIHLFNTMWSFFPRHWVIKSRKSKVLCKYQINRSWGDDIQPGDFS